MDLRNRAHAQYVAATTSPATRTNVLMELLDEPARLEYARTNGTLSTEWIARQVHGRKPTHLEQEQVAAILRDEKWKQLTKYTWKPPRGHEIKLGPYMNDHWTGNLSSEQQRSAVALNVPPMYQQKCVDWMLNHQLGRPRNKTQLYACIEDFKREFIPVSHTRTDDDELREILVEWLAAPETVELVQSRPKKYLTGAECVEGAWMVDPTLIELKRVGRLMPWTRKKLYIDGKVISAFVHPDTLMIPRVKTVRPPPDLAPLEDYLRTLPDDPLLCLYENMLKEKVLKIPLGYRSDSKHISEYLAGSGWRRKQSKHSLGTFYTRSS